MKPSAYAMKTLVFVYGTLKRGFRNHSLVADQRYCGPARTQPHYRLLDLGAYPGMIDAPAGGISVHGEVYEVDTPTLEKLDLLEDAPNLYQRLPVRLLGWTETVEAYIYHGNRFGARDCGESWESR